MSILVSATTCYGRKWLTATSAEIWPAKTAAWMARKFDPPPETKMASCGTVLLLLRSGGLAPEAEAARNKDAGLRRAKGADWNTTQRGSRDFS